VCEIPHEGPFCDLVWSDPEDVDAWAVSPRGAGWLFGARVTAEFNRINGLDLVCRAHQLVQEGLKYSFDDRSLVRVREGVVTRARATATKSSHMPFSLFTKHRSPSGPRPTTATGAAMSRPCWPLATAWRGKSGTSPRPSRTAA
jgi:hypothetical protein